MPKTTVTGYDVLLTAARDIGYREGPGMGIFVDNEGLLHAGDATTQLTWMDAQVNGLPVTPRHGCPVELNALWYNRYKTRKDERVSPFAMCCN